MTRLEFMKELESLLSDIPFEEREEALKYYNGYFDDAGEENEDEIIKELGTPKRVASIIKADLSANAQDRENRGYFTENGYQDAGYEEDKFELAGTERKNTNGSYGGTNNQNGTYGNKAGNGYNQNYNSNSYSNNNYSNSNFNNANGNNNSTNQNTYESKKSVNVGLIIILCIVGIPFIPAILGIIIGVLSAILGIIVGFGAAGIAMIVGGIALIVAGLVQISVPLMALLFCGSGLVVLGLGMLFTMACIALCKSVLPAMIRGIVNLFSRPFQKGSVAA